MASRNLGLVVLVPGLLAAIASRPAAAGEKAPDRWDKAKAAQSLDRRAEDWFKFSGANRGQGASKSSCVSCHSLLPYALARPVLRGVSHDDRPTPFEKK